jgi:cell division protein FtsB
VVTLKEKEGTLGSKTDLLNLNKFIALLRARADRRQQEIGELKENIDDLKDEMALKEVKWAVRERQLTT